MSKNLDQIFIANPITTNASTDLMYMMQSPYNSGTDAAITFANFAAQFMLAGTGVAPAQVQDQAFTSAVAVGGPTVYSMTLSPAPSAYVEGQLFTFRCPLDNTGASTMNVNTLGAKAILTTGGNACVGGEMFGGSTYMIEYNGAINAFMLINPSNYTTVPQVQQSAFNYSTNDFGAANAYVVAVAPHLASYTDGLQISFKAANANTTASTIKEGSLSAVPIVTDANAALSGGEILADGIYDVVYNSTFSAFVLLNSSASGGGGATGTQIQQQAFTYAVDSNNRPDVYVVTLSPAPASYTDGMYLCMTVLQPNSGTITPTVNVNGLGAKNIGMYYANESVDIPPLATLNPQVPVQMVYSAGQNAFIIQSNLNPAFTYANIGSSANTTAAGGPASLPVASDPLGGRDSVYFGESLTAPNLDYSLLIGNTINGGNDQCVVAIGQSIGFTGSQPRSVLAIGSFIDYSSMSHGAMIGDNNTVNAPYSLVAGNGITVGSGAGINFAVGYSITMPGHNNFAFGHNITINNAGSCVFSDGSTSITDTASNQFNAGFYNGFNFYAGSGLGPAFGIAFSIDQYLNVINSQGEADLSKLIVAPTTGTTVTLNSFNRRTIINPAGTLATLTVDMTGFPADGQIEGFSFTHIITSLTVTGGGNTIIGTPTAAAVGSSFAFIYDLATTTWYPTD